MKKPMTAWQIRVMQFKPEDCKPGFFLELYQRNKPTWDSLKAGIEGQISDIEFDMLEPYDLTKDYTVMAARRAWLQDLLLYVPKNLDEAPPVDQAGRKIRIRKIEIA